MKIICVEKRKSYVLKTEYIAFEGQILIFSSSFNVVGISFLTVS